MVAVAADDATCPDLPHRHLAASGPMPPALACKFTVSELAVLRIVGDEVRQHGHCDRCVDEIAARAGVCRSLVKNAIRTAARLGLLTVEERRREGRRNLPNVIRIVSKEWTVWLARGGRASRPAAEPMIGVKKITPRTTVIKLSVRIRQNRPLLPEGSRRIRQRSIGIGRAADEEHYVQMHLGCSRDRSNCGREDARTSRSEGAVPLEFVPRSKHEAGGSVVSKLATLFSFSTRKVSEGKSGP
jgi:hypothetical protein